MLHSGCVKLHQKFRVFVGLPMGLLREESPKNRMNTGLFGSRPGESGLKPIRIHDLRHSHSSWLIGNGMNIVAVSKRLGHASVEQTLTTYTHLIPAADEAMMRFLNKN